MPTVFWHRATAHKVANNYTDTIRQAVIYVSAGSSPQLRGKLPIVPGAPSQDFVASPDAEGGEGVGDAGGVAGMWELWAEGLSGRPRL